MTDGRPTLAVKRSSTEKRLNHSQRKQLVFASSRYRMEICRAPPDEIPDVNRRDGILNGGHET